MPYLSDDEISKIILDCAFKVHTKLGSGLLERVYNECLSYELKKNGLFIEQEKAIPVFYEEVKLDCGYRIDILVNERVVIELKVVNEINLDHIAQTLTYMRFSDCKLGLILNFYKKSLKDGIKRLVL